MLHVKKINYSNCTLGIIKEKAHINTYIRHEYRQQHFKSDLAIIIYGIYCVNTNNPFIFIINLRDVSSRSSQ